MRIISGIYKSRKLKSPGNTARVRPTSDRVKESLFNILTARLDFNGIRCLDLFCGTGGFGLECISRGATQCVFVDKSPETVNQNIDSLGVEGESEVVRDDVLGFLRDAVEEKETFDLVFADPPYDFKHYDELINLVSNLECVFVLEHLLDFKPGEKESGYVVLEKKIGNTGITFFDYSKNKLWEK